MGAWGSGAWENDTAMDWQATIVEVCDNALARCEDTYRYDEWRAAADVIIRFNMFELYETAIDRLNQILADKEWINHWVEPREITDTIVEQVHQLEMRKKLAHSG
jgi:hypothetical protein